MDLLSHLEKLLAHYKVEQLNEDNCQGYFSVFESNAQYWEDTQGSPATKQDCLVTVCYCPDNFDRRKVRCIGISECETPVAVVSLLEDYPDTGVLYLGLLLVDGEMQRKGIGTEIVDAIVKASQGMFDTIQLSVGQNNTGALRFWEKQGFVIDEVSFYRETDNLPLMLTLDS